MDRAKQQRIVKILLKRVHKVDQWTYSTQAAQKAAIDSDTLVREYQLLFDIRKVTRTIALKDAKECLMQLAKEREPRWRLSVEVDAWCRDKARELKNMLRHVAAGVYRPDWR